MNPIKVLHVVNVDKENYYLRNLADHTQGDEVDYSFVTFADDNCDFVRDLRKHGRAAYGLDCMGKLNYAKAYRELARLYDELDPDIVHTHLFDPSLIGLTVAKRQVRLTVMTRHHSDAIHQIASPPKRRFYLGLENYISRKTDHIIAPSRMVRDYLVDKEGVPATKVTIIPYGQTTARFDSVTPEKVAAVRNELGMNGTALVYVSRLFHRKGHRYLFEAFSDLTRDGLDATLYLVGDGDFQSELETMCTTLGIAERVRFLGWRDDALAIMAASDIVVHPSLEDALSSAVIESLMLEKPVIATDISGVRDSLDDGKYGTIVPPADSAAFRDAIVRVMSDREEARVRAQQGRKYLLDYMSARNVACAYRDVYRDLLETQ